MSAPSNPYLAGLTQREDALQPQVEALMEACASLPVGDGFIDIITRAEHQDQFISGATALGVAIELITLWCDCTDLNKSRFGCPHGFGGPIHDSGFFSEMCEMDYFEAKARGVDPRRDSRDPATVVLICNRLAAEYVFMQMKQRSDYSPCLVPGFWLAVPKHWVRRRYLT